MYICVYAYVHIYTYLYFSHLVSSFGEKITCSHNTLPVVGDIQREIMSSNFLRLFGSHISQRKKIKTNLHQCMDMKVIKLYNQRC